MHDARVLEAALDSRAAFELVDRHYSDNEFSPQGEFWWKLVREWYAGDTKAVGVARELLRARGEVAANHKNLDTLLGWFDALQPSPSPANVADDMLAVKRHVVGNKLGAALAGAKSPDVIRALWGEYEALAKGLAGRHSRAITLDDLATVDISTGARLPLAPTLLQERTGGALPGDHILVFARPEMGKTAFAINLAVHSARRGHRVVYFGNEEPTIRTMVRAIANILNKPQSAVVDNLQKAGAPAIARGFGNIFWYHGDPGTFSDVREAVEEVRPAMLIVDQLRNMRISNEDKRMVTVLEEGSQEMRAIASRYSLVSVSLTQAGDSADNKVWLDMGDVDNSNTGAPGACDLMIGLGGNLEMKTADRRAVSLCKNKLSGNHEGFLIKIDRVRSKII